MRNRKRPMVVIRRYHNMPKGIMLTPEQQEERREEIISVAMQLIEKNEFQKTSMRLLQVRRNSFLSPSLDISIMIYQIFLLKFLVTLVLVLLYKIDIAIFNICLFHVQSYQKNPLLTYQYPLGIDYKIHPKIPLINYRISTL